MKRPLGALGLCLALACGATPEPAPSPALGTGRDHVYRALAPPKVSALGQTGVLATLSSSLDLSAKAVFRGLRWMTRGFEFDEEHRLELVELELSDGTKVGGSLFAYHDRRDERPKPLVIASFGLMQGRQGTEAAKVHRLYLDRDEDNVEAHFLILDHPTAGAFLARNGNLSIGSYDDARMWLEVAAHMQRKLAPASIHALGVSMSGQTVVHALIEDQRRGLGLFDSGIAISIAPDFAEAPGGQFAQMSTPKGVENPWHPSRGENGLTDVVGGGGMWLLVSGLWLPSYRRVAPPEDAFSLEKSDAPLFFRSAFESRLARLSSRRPADWERDFSLDDLDAYMDATRTARVIDRVRTPLVLVSAADDPAVARWMYEEVATAASGNPWVLTYETPNGGHFGFDVAYGKQYLREVLMRTIDSRVLAAWDDPDAGFGPEGESAPPREAPGSGTRAAGG